MEQNTQMSPPKGARLAEIITRVVPSVCRCDKVDTPKASPLLRRLFPKRSRGASRPQLEPRHALVERLQIRVFLTLSRVLKGLSSFPSLSGDIWKRSRKRSEKSRKDLLRASFELSRSSQRPTPVFMISKIQTRNSPNRYTLTGRGVLVCGVRAPERGRRKHAPQDARGAQSHQRLVPTWVVRARTRHVARQRDFSRHTPGGDEEPSQKET